MNSLRGIAKKLDAVLLLVMIGLALSLVLAWHYYQTRKMTGYEKEQFAAELLAYDLPEKAAAVLEESISRQPYAQKSLKMRQALADIYMKELYQYEKALGELVFIRTFSPETASATENDIRFCLTRLGRTYDVDRRQMLDKGINPVENQVASDTIVRIGNKPVISIEDLRERMRQMNIDEKSLEKQQIEAMVQAMAREKLLRRAADRDGVERDPQFIRQIRDFENDLKLKIYLEKHVLGDMQISDAQITDFITKNARQFVGSDRVNYSCFAFADAGLAETFLRQKQGGESVDGMAAEVLADRIELPVSQLPQEIRSLNFTEAEKHEFFGPLRIGEKYLVYQIHKFAPGEKMPDDQVREIARRSLTEQKQQELLGRRIAELAAKEEMKINQQVIEDAFFKTASESVKTN